jgi:hypothetical protein
MNKTYIYTLSDPTTNEIRYVGKTDYPDKRYKQHLNSRLNNTYKEQWIFGLKDKGFVPKFEILDIVEKSEWVYWEQYWICQIKQWGFRLTNIGIGGEGGNCTLETRKKISDSKKGSQSRLGSKWTEEQRITIISKLTGKKQSESQILKRAEKNFKFIDMNILIEEYDKGLSFKQIGELMNLSESKIYRTLRDNNLIKNRRIK